MKNKIMDIVWNPQRSWKPLTATPSHWVDRVVDGGMSVRCWISAGSGFRGPRSRSVGDVSEGRARHGAGMFFGFRELRVGPRNMLQHEVMSRMNGTTKGLGISLRHLCIQKARPDTGASVKCTCVWFIIHNVRPAHTIAPPPPRCTRLATLTVVIAHPHDSLHAVCHLLRTVKPADQPRRERSPKCLTPSNGSIHTTSRYSRELQSDGPQQMSFPQRVSDSLYRKSGYVNRSLQQPSGRSSQSILDVRMMMWRSWDGLVPLSRMYWSFLWNL